MKRIIVSLLALALCVLAGAQTIKKGDCFYDGVTLFTVQEVRTGNIVYIILFQSTSQQHCIPLMSLFLSVTA